MQLFSAHVTIFLKEFKKKLTLKTRKNCPQKLLIIAQFFFQYCHPAENQPKSHFLFHKNISPRDFYIMTLCEFIVNGRDFIKTHLSAQLYKL